MDVTPSRRFAEVIEQILLAGILFPSLARNRANASPRRTAANAWLLRKTVACVTSSHRMAALP
jgi:hypothetical protein